MAEAHAHTDAGRDLPPFDTAAMLHGLEDAGVPREQARAHVNEQRKAMSSLVTTADLELQTTKINGRLDVLAEGQKALKDDMKALKDDQDKFATKEFVEAVADELKTTLEAEIAKANIITIRWLVGTQIAFLAVLFAGLIGMARIFMG